jgi:hypothetical protein
MKSIDIIESIQDDHSSFNIKRFRSGKIKSDRIIKTIDSKNLLAKDAEWVKKSFKGEPIFEHTKSVDADSIATAKQKPDTFFGKSPSVFNSSPYIVPLTFKFNPYRKYKRIDDMSGFFDMYHGYSDWLFVPNVKIDESVEEKTATGKTKWVKRYIMDVEQYLEYVDDAVRILEYKNSKPFIVPLSLKFDVDGFNKIIDHYISKEYFSIWIDFEGSAVNNRNAGKLRSIHRRIDEKHDRMKDVLLHHTNVKREIISHVMDPRTPASDVMAPICGANILGVNKEPARVVEGVSKYTDDELRLHKARVLDRETYYYVKSIRPEIEIAKDDGSKTVSGSNSMNVKHNITGNAMLLDREIAKQCQTFLDTHDLKSYVTNKEMTKANSYGKRLIEGAFDSAQKDLSKWF